MYATELQKTYESGRVGAKVLEEVGEAVKGNESGPSAATAGQLVVAEAKSAEDTGQDDEAHELNRLSSDAVNKQKGGPVARNQTGGSEDHVTNGDVV